MASSMIWRMQPLPELISKYSNHIPQVQSALNDICKNYYTNTLLISDEIKINNLFYNYYYPLYSYIKSAYLERETTQQPLFVGLSAPQVSSIVVQDNS